MAGQRFSTVAGEDATAAIAKGGNSPVKRNVSPARCDRGAGGAIATDGLINAVVFALFVAAVVVAIPMQRAEIRELLVMAAVFAFGPLIDTVPLVQKLAGSTMPLGATYTCWNCILLTYTVTVYLMTDRPPVLLPFLVINSWAIVTSFNVVRLVDSTLYRRAAEWTGYPLLAFHVFNQMFHTFPAVFTTWWFMSRQVRPHGVCSLTQLTAPVLLSIPYHFAWAMRTGQSLLLDKIYFECPAWQWGLAWTTALATHLLVGREVSWQCSFD